MEVRAGMLKNEFWLEESKLKKGQNRSSQAFPESSGEEEEVDLSLIVFIIDKKLISLSACSGYI